MSTVSHGLTSSLSRQPIRTYRIAGTNDRLELVKLHEPQLTMFEHERDIVSTAGAIGRENSQCVRNASRSNNGHTNPLNSRKVYWYHFFGLLVFLPKRSRSEKF